MTNLLKSKFPLWEGTNLKEIKVELSGIRNYEKNLITNKHII